MHRSKALLLALFAAASTVKLVGETALPNLEVVNSPWMSVTNFWQGAEPLETPTQLIVDFSRKKSGVVYGLVCEYPNKDGLFESIRQRLQKELKIKPKMEPPGPFVGWRDEVGKRTISLTLDESKKNIQVIVVSFDREV